MGEGNREEIPTFYEQKLEGIGNVEGIRNEQGMEGIEKGGHREGHREREGREVGVGDPNFGYKNGHDQLL